MTAPLTQRQQKRAALRAQHETDRARRLEKGLALYQAMFNDLEDGGVLTDAMVCAASDDRVLSVLLFRIRDYTVYQSRTRRLHRIACDDRTSIALEAHERRTSQALYSEVPGALNRYLDEVYQAAVAPPKRKRRT